MPGVSDTEARAYLSSKGVSAFIDQAIMHMLEDMPENPVEWLQAYAAKNNPGKRRNKAAPPGKAVVTKVGDGPMWSQIAAKIPASNHEEERVARAAMFNQMDANGSHSVTKEEAVAGLKERLPFGGKEGIDVVMGRAFQLIHQLSDSAKEVRHPGIDKDALTRPQFRLLLIYLKRYCELLAMFDEFDSDTDLMVDWEEFRAVVPKLEQWGVRIHYPELTFKTLDKDSRQEVPFIDFAEFVIKKELEKVPLTAEGEMEAGEVAEVREANKAMKAGRPMKSAKVSSFRRGRTGAIDWALIAQRLPYGRSEAEKERRKELFSLIDMNGNGYLSLAEVDKGMRDILKLEEIYDCKPAMMRAFQAAKGVHKGGKAKLGDDYVTKSEFRVLLEYLRMYFELFVMFDRLDDDNDRRLTEAEFVKNAGMLK
eukprot:EG_transcript_13767